MKQTAVCKKSKKEQRQLARQQRVCWGLHPATRVPPRSGAYRRNREKATLLTLLTRED